MSVPVNRDPTRPADASAEGSSRPCSVCLERIPETSVVCPECGEPVSLPSPPPPSPEGRATGWLKDHWRPLVTLSFIAGLLGFGLALRALAPEAVTPPGAGARSTAAEAACDLPCWNGEACEAGVCVFRAPNDVGHLAPTPSIAGPFTLPDEMTDVLPLDSERYLAAHPLGVQVTSARSGEILSLISDAPQVQQLFRVGDAVYAASPLRIYVLDAATAAVQKTIELGRPVGDLAVGAAGARVVVSLPTISSVAVIATDYHSEIARFAFGDDVVGPVAIDDSGKRALTSNGNVPPIGFKPSLQATQFGAAYAFDPSRLPSQQDRVRTGMEGNPVDALVAPNAWTSFVLLRERNAIVPLEHPPSEAVRPLPAIPTCEQPDQFELVRDGRRAVVRCGAGRALEVVDLARREPIRRVAVNAHASDLAVSPDSRQALVALPRDEQGALGILDLRTYELSLIELGSEAHRVRFAPDGKTAVAISNRYKSAWVLR